MQEKKLQWWCAHLATRLDLQGNGFATALMGIGYKKAMETKELGTFIGLMTGTDENVNKYTSMGLKKIGETVLPMPRGNMSIHVLIRKP